METHRIGTYCSQEQEKLESQKDLKSIDALRYNETSPGSSTTTWKKCSCFLNPHNSYSPLCIILLILCIPLNDQLCTNHAVAGHKANTNTCLVDE